MKNKISLMAVIGAVIESFLPLHAENKTGLQTPYVWMCTSPVENKIDYNYVWKDLNGNNVVLNVDGKECVNNRTDIYTYNFYPSLSFSNDNNSLLRIEGSGLQKATVIGVYGFNKVDDLVDDGFVMNLSNGWDEDETAITKAKVIHTTPSSRKSFVYKDRNLKGAKTTGTPPKSNKEAEKNLRIMSYTKSSNPRTTVASTFSNINIGGKFVDGVTSKTGLFHTDSFPEKERSNRNISVPELMVYDRALTDTARKRAESYLALKYAITLDVDYLLDTVVWKKDDTYTRICGYGRMDKYNFLQSQVTTSERELIYMTDDNYLKDTYFKNSFLNKSAYENLLVAGRYGVIEDSSLVMFGDNDKEFAINRKDTIFSKSSDAMNFIQEQEEEMYFPVKRVWKVRNLSKSISQVEKEKLMLEGIDIKETYAGSFDIKVPADTFATIQDLSSFINKGEISWVANSLTGTITVSVGSHIYKFDNKGAIYVDEKKIDNKYKTNDMIEIVKNDTLLYIRKNGENITSSRIVVNKGETEWNALLTSDKKMFEINQFHYFSDDNFNDFVELSYDFDDSLSFYSNGNIYLIASNMENFKDEEAELQIYKMSSKDRARSKVTFEGLAWENGYTYFTIAVSGTPELGIADKKYIIEEILPDCKSPNQSATGSVVITFPDEESYAYVLLKDGYFASDGLAAKNVAKIENLCNGEYSLYITPHTGTDKFDIEGECETPEMVSLKYPFYDKSKMSATWVVGDAQSYNMSGVTLTKEHSQIVCGVKIEGGMIYKVENGESGSEGYSVKEGDTIKVAGAGNNKLKAFVNGKEMFEMTQSMNGVFYWSILTAQGRTVRHIEFEEFRVSGSTPVSVYNVAENFINSEHLAFRDADLFTYEFSMYCPDEEDMDNDNKHDSVEDNLLTEGDVEKMFVYSTTNGTHSATVRCYLPKGSWPNLTISDSNGVTYNFGMYIISETEDQVLYQSDIYVNNDGTYTATVKTDETTLSGKFIIK